MNDMISSRNPIPRPSARQNRGKASQARGVRSEALAARVLVAEGWQILAERCRTGAGEIDLIITREGVLVFVEVKSRASLADAAYALGPRQMQRLLAAAEAWMAANPDQGEAGVRFDVMLVDPAGQVRRIVDAMRAE